MRERGGEEEVREKGGNLKTRMMRYSTNRSVYNTMIGGNICKITQLPSLYGHNLLQNKHTLKVNEEINPRS